MKTYPSDPAFTNRCTDPQVIGLSSLTPFHEIVINRYQLEVHDLNEYIENVGARKASREFGGIVDQAKINQQCGG